MAKFCTSCGSTIEETGKFCNKCGTPAPAAGTPAVPSPPVQAAPPSPTAAAPSFIPAPSAPKKPSPVLKIVLIVGGVFVLLIVIAIASVVYVGYRVKQKVEQTIKLDEAGKSVTIQTPEGPVTMGESKEGEAEKAATVDVPPYPNSTPTEGGGQMSFGGKGGISGQEYETPDTVEQVLAFYKEKFGSKLTIHEAEGNATFMYSTPNGMTTVTLTRDEESAVTKINITRIGK